MIGPEVVVVGSISTRTAWFSTRSAPTPTNVPLITQAGGGPFPAVNVARRPAGAGLGLVQGPLATVSSTRPLPTGVSPVTKTTKFEPAVTRVPGSTASRYFGVDGRTGRIGTSTVWSGAPTVIPSSRCRPDRIQARGVGDATVQI